ncbi:MAG TPA: hypothetical protein VEQ66_16030 [Propionibacteriaceae bacterium]|nr:hypothetical protein [Propionibacteriaceae bacterium]
MAERPPTSLAIAVLAAHAAITAVTWRDLSRRPRSQLRGSHALWRLVSALNTSGSLAYLLVGRRR